jgi:hypothetical protein
MKSPSADFESAASASSAIPALQFQLANQTSPTQHQQAL